MTALATRAAPVHLIESIKLVDWQEQAVQNWWKGDSRGQQRGTLEVFTGGGKTLIALSAFSRVTQTDPSTHLAVVVPTEALARQWVVAITKYTSISKKDVGVFGA